MMWRNMKISTKLLLGFGLVLLIFAIAVFVTWSNLRSLREISVYMENAVIPSMAISSEIEKHAYELFLAADTMELVESDESIKAVEEARKELL
jgi:hypothetical protein